MDQPSSGSPFDLLHDDLLIDEILSRVDSAQSILRLSMASKRLHSLCSYPSVLDFEEVPDNVGFIKHLDKFFGFRMNNKSNIKHEFRRLQICLPEKMNNLPILDFVTLHLLGWFHKALSLNVQELILEFAGEPVSSDCYLERPELSLQYSTPLEHLRVLRLEDIPIALNDSFEDWISTTCVNLEELNLSDVLVLPTKLRIASSSLRVFVIEGDFKELHVSAPKLVDLRVTWNLINLNRVQSHPFIKISDTPNLQSFVLENLDTSYDSLRYGSSGDIQFPSLKCAFVLLPAEPPLISHSSLERLLLDISQTRILHLSDAILHQISQGRGIIHYANLFRKLHKFHVRIEGDKWWEKADTIMSFVKNVPSLKIFKLTIASDDYDLQIPQEWLQNALYLNVLELDLQCKDYENMDNYHNHLNVPELKLHYHSSLEHLRVLTLKDIPIALNHSFENWVSTCCVNLQELNLSGVLVLPTNLRITSSSLRVFTIDAHFTNLHISAPELVSLHVTWNLVYHGTDETSLSLKVSDSPNLEDFLLSSWNRKLPLEYYNCCGDKNNFPSLQSATVLIPDIANNISLDSFKRLLLDLSRTRKLYVSDAILHKISCSGIIDSLNSIHTLEELRVRVEVDKRSRCWENAHQTMMSSVKKVPSLKTFELTIKNHNCDPLVSKTFRESLIDNIFKLGFSRSAIYLDDNKVKVVVGPGDDETLLLEHIIKNAPRDFKFIFLYQR